MNVILAKSAGFCYGVKRAVELAQKTAGECEHCWMLGDLIHNTHVVEDLARRVYLSPSYFGKVFKEETGETFVSFLNRVRIERSKELLQRKHIRLSDIAQMVGFEEQSYFCRVFKKLVGVTPTHYRESGTSAENSNK